MYLYSLSGWEHNIVVWHKKKFDQQEFEWMCEGAKHDKYNYYDSDKLVKHLKNSYGFKKASYTAGFFTDGQ